MLTIVWYELAFPIRSSIQWALIRSKAGKAKILRSSSHANPNVRPLRSKTIP
jgi:hypothetical protein